MAMVTDGGYFRRELSELMYEKQRERNRIQRRLSDAFMLAAVQTAQEKGMIMKKYDLKNQTVTVELPIVAAVLLLKELGSGNRNDQFEKLQAVWDGSDFRGCYPPSARQIARQAVEGRDAYETIQLIRADATGDALREAIEAVEPVEPDPQFIIEAALQVNDIFYPLRWGHGTKGMMFATTTGFPGNDPMPPFPSRSAAWAYIERNLLPTAHDYQFRVTEVS